MKGCGKNIDGWNRCGVMEQGESIMYCDDCKKVRENGYYWVIFMDDWIIAEWYGEYKFWTIPGDERSCDDGEMIEIDENRITRGE